MMFHWKKLFYTTTITLASTALLLCAGCSSRQIIDGAAETVKTANEPDAEVIAAIEIMSGENYVYQTLDPAIQKVYDEIVYAIENHAEAVTVSTLVTDDIETAYRAVLADHCEYFYLDQLSYVTHTINEEVSYIDITPEYSMTMEEQEAYQTQIDARVAEILAGAPVDGTDYEKALYVYRTLIETIDYVTDAPENQNIISAFVHGQTVCQGYSYATQYLLKELGIPCSTVSGYVDGQTHAWNLVYLDGNYYYIDTTWGNSQFVNGQGDEATEQKTKYVDYDFFAVTTEEIQRTHTFEDAQLWPDCTATADNYYRREGLYIDTWDPDAIGAIVNAAYTAGEPSAQVKLATDELYTQTMTYFLEDGHIWDYCFGLQEVNYVETQNSTLFMLIFH